MSRRKVLHIAQSAGGVSEYLKSFFRYSDNNKYDIYLICSYDYINELEEFKKLNCKIFLVDMKREINLIKDFKSIYSISRIVKKVNPDIIHCHSSKGGVYGRLIALKYKIPVIYNSHGWAFDMNISNIKKFIYVYIEKILGIFTDKIVNISYHDNLSAISHKIAKQDKMKLIPNGIDLEKFKLYNNDKYKDKYVVGMVGRISEQKSPNTFVEIAKKINEQIPNAYFILVGDGDKRKEIEQLIRSYKLEDKFLITGWVNNTANYINVFDIALLTSKWEGFGLVLAEYMAMKKPIVASNVGGIPDVVNDNINGFIVEYGDIDMFVKKILYIKNNEKVRSKFINNGKNIVEKNFNIKRVVKEHEDLYETLKKRRVN